MQFKKIAFLIISITLFITGCDSKKDEENKQIVTSEKKDTLVLPTFTQQTLNLKKESNEKVVIKELAGKVVLLNFWATWCPPCKAEIPHLINLRKKYEGKFEVVGVNLGKRDGTLQTIEELKPFIEKYQIDYPITIDENNFKLSTLMGGIRTIPTMFMIDGTGKIVQKYVGVVPEEMLETDIKRALGK